MKKTTLPSIVFGFSSFIVIIALIIPNFFHFTAKARQSDAKSNLFQLSKQINWLNKENKWVCDWSTLKWKIQDSKYAYFLTPEMHVGHELEWIPNEKNRLVLSLPIDFKKLGAPNPGCSAFGFTAVAIGNIDADSSPDVWWVSLDNVPVNSMNDIYH